MNTIEKAMAHPQTKARKMVQNVRWEALKSGGMDMVGPPVKFSRSEAAVKQPSPLLGQHTKAILEELGYTSSEVE